MKQRERLGVLMVLVVTLAMSALVLTHAAGCYSIAGRTAWPSRIWGAPPRVNLSAPVLPATAEPTGATGSGNVDSPPAMEIPAPAAPPAPPPGTTGSVAGATEALAYDRAWIYDYVLEQERQRRRAEMVARIDGYLANRGWLHRYYGSPQSAYDCPGYCVPNQPWMDNVDRVRRSI